MVLTQDLTESQQMSRLLQFLDGKARIAVAGFEGIPGGLYKAMRLLENRYGQLWIIAFTLCYMKYLYLYNILGTL
jgi:hypothetical protein